MYEKMIAAIVRKTQERMEEIDKSSITTYQMLYRSEKMERTAYKAMIFAREAHKAQRRKYTNNPYEDHLAEVAGIVATVAPLDLADLADLMVSVAWLHDCVEDQGVTVTHLRAEFGDAVADGVRLLSDLEKGNRAERKALSRARLADAPGWVQTIKCADLISNTSSIVMHDPAFALVYLEEKRLLLDCLTEADPRLLTLARMQASAA
jgi:(p)ppGpp synthase/HD superfamily hydrolase